MVVETIFKLIGIVLLTIIGVALAVIFSTAMLVFIALFAAMFLVANIFGYPIKITKDDVLIGHVVRFRFISLTPIQKLLALETAARKKQDEF